MKKMFLILIGFITVVILILIVRFVLGGPEDNWICQKGIWVKHGNPSTPAPTTPCGTPVPQNITYTNATNDLIVVDLPLPDTIIGKEFSVSGKARGNWYFEASFPIQIIDKDRKVLATGVAQAQSDWMTTDFVPFKADLKITNSYIGPATLILKKDNPSGMPEKDASISFEINVE
jgi:hypothetical protein